MTLPDSPLAKLGGKPKPGPHATLHLLRRQIIDGQIAPGCRLPTRRELLNSMGVSSVTLQRALHRLEQEGFVRLVDRVGSFVAEKPPHLSRYPIIFTAAPNSPDRAWNRYWDTIKAFVPEVAEKAGVAMPIFLNIDGHEDNNDFHKLVRDVQVRRLAGLIFPTNPWLLKDSPLVTEPGVARVAMSRSGNGLHSVFPDFGSFFARAAEYLAGRGRRRMALLVQEQMLSERNIDVETLLDRYGLATRPEWTQVIGRNCRASAQSILHLLMSSGYSERPDGLILADDNWIAHATAGLTAAGVRIPDDLDVVTHCNFPYAPSLVVPFKCLGWDVRHLLSVCLEVLAAQREGRNPPLDRPMPAVFDHELTTT